MGQQAPAANQRLQPNQQLHEDIKAVLAAYSTPLNSLSLGRIPKYFKSMHKRRLDLDSTGFTKLKDLLLTVDGGQLWRKEKRGELHAWLDVPKPNSPPNSPPRVVRLNGGGANNLLAADIRALLRPCDTPEKGIVLAQFPAAFKSHHQRGLE